MNTSKIAGIAICTLLCNMKCATFGNCHEICNVMFVPVIFISYFASCVFHLLHREEEPKTTYAMPFMYASHIAASMHYRVQNVYPINQLTVMMLCICMLLSE